MEPAPQAPAALCREPHGDAGPRGPASLVRRRMRVDDRLSAERKRNRFRTRGPKSPDSSRRHGLTREAQFWRCTEENYFQRLILNPIEKELRVRRQKNENKNSEEEHAEEVLRTCFKENVC